MIQPSDLFLSNYFSLFSYKMSFYLLTIPKQNFFGRRCSYKRYRPYCFLHASLPYWESSGFFCFCFFLNSNITIWNPAFPAPLARRGGHVTQPSETVGENFWESSFSGTRPFLPPLDIFTFPPKWMAETRLQILMPCCCHRSSWE